MPPRFNDLRVLWSFSVAVSVRIGQAGAPGIRWAVVCELIGVGRDQKFKPVSLNYSLTIGGFENIRDEVADGKGAIRRVARAAEIRKFWLLRGCGDELSRRQAGLRANERRGSVTGIGRDRPVSRGASH